MDCESFQSQMVDFLEVGEKSSAGEALRTHLDACGICAEAFKRLQAGQSWADALPLVEPPAKLDERVMAAARTAVGETRSKVPRATGSKAPAEVIPLFRRVLRSGSTSQLAVAAALLLMISVGYLGMDFRVNQGDLAEPPIVAAPESRQASEPDHAGVARAEEEEELAPALPSEEPNANLDDHLDRAMAERASVERERAAAQAAVLLQGENPFSAGGTDELGALAERDDNQPADQEAFGRGRYEGSAASARPRARAREERRPGAMSADPPPGSRGGGLGGLQSSAASPNAPTSADRASPATPAPAAPAPAAPREQLQAESAAAPPSRQPSSLAQGRSQYELQDDPVDGQDSDSEPTLTGLLQRGVEAYSARDYGRAISLLRGAVREAERRGQAAGAERRAAHLYLARAHAGINDWLGAVRHYRAHGAARARGGVLLEFANALARSGALAEADRMYALAEREQPLAARARQARARLRTEERARQTRSAASESAASEEAASEAAAADEAY